MHKHLLKIIIGAFRRIKNYFYPSAMAFLANKVPTVHCKILVKPGGKYEMDLIPDLKKPRYLNEKLLWLKYYRYNGSRLVASCYDKYSVRDYVKSRGLEHILNDLYGVWNTVEEIKWNRLPEEYILKVTNGSANHVFKTIGSDLCIDDAEKILTKSMKERNRKFRITGDLFALISSQRIICERLILAGPEEMEPPDYKIYCFHGEPKYLLYIEDRHNNLKRAFKDIELQDRSDLLKDAENIAVKKPECYKEMLDYARILSEPFPFVRADFYIENSKPVFGELTFTPAGSFIIYHSHNLNGLLEMGNNLSLERIAEYDKWL